MTQQSHQHRQVDILTKALQITLYPPSPPPSFTRAIPQYSAESCTRNSAELRTNSEKIPTSAEFQKSTSVETLLQRENRTNEKQQLLFVCWKRKNGKLPFVFCKQKRKMEVCFLRSANEMVIDDCCFSKCAHKWKSDRFSILSFLLQIRKSFW